MKLAKKQQTLYIFHIFNNGTSQETCLDREWANKKYMWNTLAKQERHVYNDYKTSD